MFTLNVYYHGERKIGLDLQHIFCSHAQDDLYQAQTAPESSERRSGFLQAVFGTELRCVVEKGLI